MKLSFQNIVYHGKYGKCSGREWRSESGHSRAEEGTPGFLLQDAEPGPDEVPSVGGHVKYFV